MTIRDRKLLKQTAARRLTAASYPPRRLILIHSGILLGIWLLMAVCNYIITWQIDANGGGLSGIQLRSILETVSNMLLVVYAVVTPFWTMGLVYASIRLARGKAAWPGSLLEGFGRKGPVLRLLLLQTLIYGVITMASLYGAWVIYAMFPAGQAFMEAVLKLIAAGYTDSVSLIEQIPEPVMEQVTRGYLPCFCLVLLVLATPAFYRLRLANYLVMDEPGTGAWKAVRTSGRIMRRNGWRLALLDLGYWWYYLIPVVLMLPTYAEPLLEKLQLPVDGAVAYLVGSLLYVVLNLAFDCAAKPRVMTTYALAYDALVEEYNAKQPPKPAESEETYGI